jgi:uncharacterized protein (UPF0548 family)
VLIRRHADRAAMARVLGRAASHESTFTGGLEPVPPGFRSVRHREAIGSGAVAFAAAAEAILTWDMHRRAGLEVCAAAPRAETGTDVVVAITLGPLVDLLAPCRVDDVIDEPRRRGFSYLTLPGHPERGRETFLAELDVDGVVWVSIAAVSRAGSTLTTVAGPFGRLVQRRATVRYAEAVRAAVASGPTTAP